MEGGLRGWERTPERYYCPKCGSGGFALYRLRQRQWLECVTCGQHIGKVPTEARRAIRQSEVPARVHAQAESEAEG